MQHLITREQGHTITWALELVVKHCMLQPQGANLNLAFFSPRFEQCLLFSVTCGGKTIKGSPGMCLGGARKVHFPYG